MKKTTAIAGVTACAGVIAFLISGMNSPKDESEGKESGAEKRRDAMGSSRPSGDAAAVKERERQRKVPEDPRKDDPRLDASKLSREERLTLLEKGSLAFDKNAHLQDMLDVIAALQTGEMRDAVELIGKAQRFGNRQPAEVWTALWYQWGKVDPLDCFARFRERPEGKGADDVKNTMRGWLETDPAGAAAWARQPDRSPLESYAAAMALAHAADGDSMKLQADLQSMPDGPTKKQGVGQLFDMELMTENGRGADQIYESLPDSLKSDAWGYTVKRLAVTDPEAAKAWLGAHAGDSGADYRSSAGLVRELAKADPEGTAKWAVNLPANEISPANLNGPPHPVIEATMQWMRQDAAAAEEWLRTLPADQAWTGPVLEIIRNRK